MSTLPVAMEAPRTKAHRAQIDLKIIYLRDVFQSIFGGLEDI
jgi:hypothetical protein